MFLATLPIVLWFTKLPLISPGSPFSPLAIESTFAVVISPLAMVTSYPVSTSTIPCPKAAKLLVDGS